MDATHICYTGIGARKSGNHTEKQYLAVMDKNFETECPVYIKSLKCKSCKQSKKMNTEIAKRSLKAQVKNKTYKMSKKTEAKLVKQISKCAKCKKNTTQKCNVKKYIEFSGANQGKCEK